MATNRDCDEALFEVKSLLKKVYKVVEARKTFIKLKKVNIHTDVARVTNIINQQLAEYNQMWGEYHALLLDVVRKETQAITEFKDIQETSQKFQNQKSVHKLSLFLFQEQKDAFWDDRTKNLVHARELAIEFLEADVQLAGLQDMQLQRNMGSFGWM